MHDKITKYSILFLSTRASKICGGVVYIHSTGVRDNLVRAKGKVLLLKRRCDSRGLCALRLLPSVVAVQFESIKQADKERSTEVWSA